MRIYKIAFRAIFVVVALSVLLTSGCYTRNPFKTPLTETFAKRGATSSNWLLFRINAVHNETNLRYYLVYRFYSNSELLVITNGQCVLYSRHWRHYGTSNMGDAKNILGAGDEADAPLVYFCEINGGRMPILNVDSLKEQLPQVDCVIIEDGHIGFPVLIPKAKPFSHWESVTLFLGGDDLVAEAATFKELLEKLKTTKVK